MKNRPVVYIASPYSQGIKSLNVEFQCQVFDKLRNDNVVVPIVPLWSHFQDARFPRAYEDWMDYDFALLDRCDALLRLDAVLQDKNYRQHESGGADREVAYVRDILESPVFFSISELYHWASERDMDALRAKELVDRIFGSVG